MVYSTIEEQERIAERILGRLLAYVHRDETTDHTGFNISKRKLSVHVSQVLKDIRKGIFQEKTLDKNKILF